MRFAFRRFQMKGRNITLQELSRKFEEVENSNSEMLRRLSELEKSNSELNDKLNSIEAASAHYVGLAEKMTVLAKTVNRIRQERDVWKDRIIWLIVLLLVTSAYNYIPKLFSCQQAQQNQLRVIGPDELSEIIEQININRAGAK